MVFIHLKLDMIPLDIFKVVYDFHLVEEDEGTSSTKPFSSPDKDA